MYEIVITRLGVYQSYTVEVRKYTYSNTLYCKCTFLAITFFGVEVF